MSLEHIRGWLIDLSKHVGRAQDLGDLAALIESTAAMLETKAPPDLFTPDSLEFCLRRFKFFPAYAELWARLQTYQREQTKQLALPPPSVAAAFSSPEAPISDADRPHVDAWLRAEANKTADLGARLAVVRKLAARGFDWLVRNNIRAGEIALHRGWIADADTSTMPERMRTEWDDPAFITRRVADLTAERDDPRLAAVDANSLRFMAGLVARWAPQNLHLIPNEVPKRANAIGAQRTPTPQQQADMRADDGIVTPPKITPESPPAARKPHGALTPEQLHEVRMNNPALRPFAEQKAARKAEIDAGAIYEDYLPEATPEPEPEPLRAAAKVIPIRKKRAPMPYDDEVPA